MCYIRISLYYYGFLRGSLRVPLANLGRYIYKYATHRPSPGPHEPLRALMFSLRTFRALMFNPLTVSGRNFRALRVDKGAHMCITGDT